MSQPKTELTLQETLLALRNEGLVSESERDEIKQRASDGGEIKTLPYYFQILTGLGSFIAFPFFVGFLHFVGILNLDSATSLIAWGIGFILLALGLTKLFGKNIYTIKESFLLQTSLCAIILGKLLFAVGFSESDFFGKYDDWGATLAVLLTTVATYRFYPLFIERFASVFALGVLAQFSMAYNPLFSLSRDVGFNVFFLIQLVIASVLFTRKDVRAFWMPVAYGVMASLAVSVFDATKFSLAHFFNEANKTGFSAVFINAVLAVALLGLILWAAGGWASLKKEPILLASLAVILLGVFTTPGILFSIGLLVLGYAKRAKVLLVSGLCFLPVFLTIYYYSLQTSLLAKSGILFASGAVLLLGYGYLVLRKVNQKA